MVLALAPALGVQGGAFVNDSPPQPGAQPKRKWGRPRSATGPAQVTPAAGPRPGRPTRRRSRPPGSTWRTTMDYYASADDALQDAINGLK
jgi:hypothetical protein